MVFGDVLDERTEAIAKEIVDAIFCVHSTLGPGLLESVYEQCLILELEFRGLKVDAPGVCSDCVSRKNNRAGAAIGFTR